MILYFSGTGNSAYVAKRIGAALGEEAVDLLERLRGHDHAPMESARPWVVVAPTYAWRIPHILREWLKRTDLTGSREIYFVMTCGGSIGNAGKYLGKLCKAKGMDYRGCVGITMPENYIALFSTPTREEALETIEVAEGEMDRAAQRIKGGEALPLSTITTKDRLNSGVVNDLFYPLLVHAKKFSVGDGCISCEICAGSCPMNNIAMEAGRPVWGKHCTHCMACICRCPVEAIEYGEHSKGLPRYVCPK